MLIDLISPTCTWQIDLLSDWHNAFCSSFVQSHKPLSFRALPVCLLGSYKIFCDSHFQDNNFQFALIRGKNATKSNALNYFLGLCKLGQLPIIHVILIQELVCPRNKPSSGLLQTCLTARELSNLLHILQANVSDIYCAERRENVCYLQLAMDHQMS